ncbi:MAG: terminase TerL endonuclease subunit, partial [Oscillospiraceae bacterium]
DGVPKWTVLFRAWMPDSDLDAREKRDYAPYGDWYRAGFLTRCVGDTIDFDDVQKTILQAAADYKLKTLGVDPYLSRMMTMELMRNQVAVVEIPQDMKNLSPAMKLIETLLRKRQMEHQHNTCCRSCFIRTRCAVDGNENKKPMKNKSTGRIDLVVAWIIAMAAALLDERAPDMNRAVEAYLNAMNQNGGDV